MASITSFILAALVATVFLADACSGLHHYGRDSWQAARPKRELEAFSQKAQIIYLHPTQTDDCGNNNINCKPMMRAIQKNHMDSGCDDIGFNFAVGGCTGIFEGSGWKGMSPFSLDEDVPTVHIGVIGQYKQGHSIPSNVQQTVIRLVNEGVNNGKISPNAEYKCTYTEGDHSGFELSVPNKSEKIRCVQKPTGCMSDRFDYVMPQ